MLWLFPYTFFALFGFGWLLKPLIAVVLVLALATSCYMDSYGIVFDDVMVMNVLQTNIYEAFDLLEPGVVIHIALYGLLPVLLLLRINVKSLPLLKTVYTRAIAIYFVLSIASLSVYASYKDFSFVFRENREISFFVNPVYPMKAIYRYTKKKIRSHSARFVMAMKDAHRIKLVSHLEKSDHGESLGENGVYLHVLPYYMAPDYQKHIPMILWMSDRFSASKQMNRQCLQAKVVETLSYDNVFHSVLGLMDVSVSHYRKDLDLFDTCRSGSAVASLSAGSSVR